jgi:hypothetical protein
MDAKISFCLCLSAVTEYSRLEKMGFTGKHQLSWFLQGRWTKAQHGHPEASFAEGSSPQTGKIDGLGFPFPTLPSGQAPGENICYAPVSGVRDVLPWQRPPGQL